MQLLSNISNLVFFKKKQTSNIGRNSDLFKQGVFQKKSPNREKSKRKFESYDLNRETSLDVSALHLLEFSGDDLFSLALDKRVQFGWLVVGGGHADERVGEGDE